MSTFNYKLAFHCAPTLAGVKPANLISIPMKEWGAMKDGLARSGRVFGGRQIYFRRLDSCDRRVLLLIYRRDLLATHLALPKSRRILEEHGYDADMTVGRQLNKLSERIKQAGSFPHEIGIFLGYPPEDVQGFIENHGKNCCLCGCWKVYGDPTKAKRLFSLYEHTRCYFCERVLRGEEIHNIQYGGIA